MVSVERVGTSFVARVDGIDLGRDLDDETWDEIRRAYRNHKVLFFHKQSLTAKQLCDFGEAFGEIIPHTIRKFWHAEEPRITVLSNRIEYGKPKGIKDAGSFWHSDWSYLERPANATMLYAIEIPAEGGDTLFCDLTAAYDALTPAMKQRLDGLQYRCQYRFHRDRNHPESRWRIMTEEERAESPERVRPLIRTHPETGRKAIYVGSHTESFDGMTDEESDPIIKYLMEHTHRPEFVCRVRWDVNTLVFWDNRCCQHCAINDYNGQRRRVQKITISGDTPF